MILDELISEFFSDPFLVFIVAVLVGFVFLVYLFLRRTAKEFKEGMKQDRQ